MTRKKNERITLQQVAEHAGVSRATASLIVRGSPKISKETREKVLKSINELGYVYDRVAANLRSQQRSTTVGLIITELANPFFSELLDGINCELEKEGYTILLGSTSNSFDKQEKLLATMIENRVGGLIWCPVSTSGEEMVDHMNGSFNHLNIPIVLVGKQLMESKYDYVGADNVTGAKAAVKHLIGLGHNRIAFIGGPQESSAREERKQGYILALIEAGIEIDDSLIINSSATREGGKVAIQQLFEQQNPPKAIFCYNDIIAIGAMQELKMMGIIPGKFIDIIGFDNIQESEIVTPTLSTVGTFPRLTGIHAAKLLHRRMDGYIGDPQKIILQPEFIIRNSCGK